jgi:hypothetical protein
MSLKTFEFPEEDAYIKQTEITILIEKYYGQRPFRTDYKKI